MSYDYREFSLVPELLILYKDRHSPILVWINLVPYFALLLQIEVATVYTTAIDNRTNKSLTANSTFI
jgi:hypothetical protein